MRTCTSILAASLAVSMLSVLPMTGNGPALALKADRLLDVRSGRIIEGALVVVAGDQILSVGGEVNGEVRVLNLGNVTLMPGMMDLHTHLVSELRVW